MTLNKRPATDEKSGVSRALLIGRYSLLHSDASIIARNRVEILLNGKQIFPALLQTLHGGSRWGA
jgi:hypothetical protein